MNIIERISKLLKTKKLSQKDLTDYLDLKQSAFTDWKTGKTDSYLKSIPEIAEFLNVSTDYLYFGKESSPTIILSDEERDIILAYRSQGEEGKKIIRRSLGIEESTNQKKILDLKSELQIDMTKAFTKTTT